MNVWGGYFWHFNFLIVPKVIQLTLSIQRGIVLQLFDLFSLMQSFRITIENEGNKRTNTHTHTHAAHHSNWFDRYNVLLCLLLHRNAARNDCAKSAQMCIHNASALLSDAQLNMPSMCHHAVKLQCAIQLRMCTNAIQSHSNNITFSCASFRLIFLLHISFLSSPELCLLLFAMINLMNWKIREKHCITHRFRTIQLQKSDIVSLLRRQREKQMYKSCVSIEINESLGYVPCYLDSIGKRDEFRRIGV